MIRKINALKGEKYPHRIFLDKSPEDEADEFGAELVDPVAAVVAPAFPAITDGGVCTNRECKHGLHREEASKLCRDCADPEDISCPPVPDPEPETTPEMKGFDLVHTQVKGGGSSGLHVMRISDSPDRPIDWLWPDRIPAGGPFTFSGPIGSNKSMALLDIASRISNGADWPDGSENEFGPREVLICATEDELQTVIRPRLRAAGADLTKCLNLENAFDVDRNGIRKNRPMELEKDTQRLYEAVLRRRKSCW